MSGDWNSAFGSLGEFVGLSLHEASRLVVIGGAIESAESSVIRLKVKDLTEGAEGEGFISNKNIVSGTAQEVSRIEIMKKVDDIVTPYAKQIKELYPDAEIGYRGSLARGFKKGDDKFGPFNPKDFDVDAFIVSDKLASEVKPPQGSNFRSARDVDSLRSMQNDINKSLRTEFSGLRQNSKDQFTFRIWTREEFEQKVGADERVFLVK